MKIAGLLGSGRKGGNTEILLDVALEEAREMGSVHIQDHPAGQSHCPL